MRTSLKMLRKEKDFTQAQIAELSNISERQYRRIESGEQTPSVEVAILIADALNVKNIKDIFPLRRQSEKEVSNSKTPQLQLRKVEDQPDGNRAEKNTL